MKVKTMLQAATTSTKRTIQTTSKTELNNEPVVVALNKTTAKFCRANLLSEIEPTSISGHPVILVCGLEDMAQPLEQLRQMGAGSIYPVNSEAVDLLTEIERACLTAKALTIIPGKRKPSAALHSAAKACMASWPEVFGGEIDLALEKKARLAGSVVEFTSTTMLAACSGLMLGRYRAEVRPGFLVRPTFWGIINAPSGDNKSQAMASITDLVRQKQTELFRDHKSVVALCKENGEDAPPAPRALYQNTSIEALQCSLSAQKRGGFAEFDEVVEWVNSWSRYSSGVGNRGAWLSAHNGDSLVVDRKHLKEPMTIDCWGVSLVGGIQPETLNSFNESLALSDGLGARIKFVRPASPPVAIRPNPDDHLGIEIIETIINELFEQRIQAAPEQLIPFSAEARERFENWRYKLLNKQAKEGRDDAWVSKLPGTVASIALIICGVQAAAKGKHPTEITVDHVRKAAKLSDVLTAHRRRVESELGSPLIERLASEFAAWVVKHKVTEASTFELRKGLIPGIRSEATLRRVLLELQDAAWLDQSCFISSRHGDSLPPFIKINSGVKDFYAKNLN